ncbi:hypothetical protein FOZ63_018511 [Perkinsus olseni]|uniref:Dynein light chain n=1 Tax=Perkinsus olseni TaxID=32597 RepID=A0A7J6RUE9_PEROL|nr:hypothetical protein FOZ63_018511 [Perkinsus olseni]
MMCFSHRDWCTGRDGRLWYLLRMDQRPRGSSPPLYGPPPGSYSILLPSSTYVHNFQLPVLPTGPANFAITGLPDMDENSSSSSEYSNDEGASLKESLFDMLSTLSWPRVEVEAVRDAFASSVAKFEESVDSAWEWLSRPVPLCGGPPREYDPASEEIVYEWAPPVSQCGSITSVGSLGNHRHLAAEAQFSFAPSTSASSSQQQINSMSSVTRSEAESNSPTGPVLIGTTARKVIDKLTSRRRQEKADLYGGSSPFTTIPPPCQVIPDEAGSSVDSFGAAIQRIRWHVDDAIHPYCLKEILVSFVDRSLNLMSMDSSSERPVESLTASAPTQPQVHTTCHVAAMPGDILNFILKEAKACEVKRLKDPSSSYSAVAKKLKDTIEQHHPGTWHVFVGKDFGAHVSAEANHLAHFNVGATAFMIYKHG